MSNASNLSTLANVLDDGTSGQFLKSTGSGGVAFDTVAAGAVVYATADLLPLSGNSAGDMAYVTATNRFYINNGSGWYSVSLVNTNPNITSVQDASSGTTPFTLATDGTATVITVTAADPEEVPLTYGYSVTSGSLNGSTVAQGTGSNTNVFTVTPHASNASSFTVTFSASDGINTSTSDAAFTLSFVANWSIASQQAKIVSTDISNWDYFGYFVSISEDGNTAISGAKGDNSDTGSAYIFTRSGTSWSQQTKLTASDAATGDYFGWSTSLSDDSNTAIVGAVGEGTTGSNAGSVYIFSRSGSTWSQQAKLQASDAASSDNFGWSTSLSEDGNTAIASTPWKNSSTGAAYIFTRSGSTWSQQAKLTASDAASNDYFGYSVSISDDGNTAVVGASQEGTTASLAGSAYIFTRSGSTWSQQAKIQASDAAYGDNFGWAISISGDGNNLLIGAPFKGWQGGGYGGTVYIFTRSGSTWSQQARVNPSNFGSGDKFGHSVSISQDGNIAIVGAIAEDSTATNAGSVYIYSRTGTSWSEQKRMQGSDVAAYSEFGQSVSISGDGETAIASTPNISASSGAAYILVAG
jgi:hypothetical protein